jgi:Mn2+/Fe2+ NRAMP family transporter
MSSISLVVPSLHWDKEYLTTVVAVLGTTISPYLFFWQASQEAEDVRTAPARQILKRAPASRSQSRSDHRRKRP